MFTVISLELFIMSQGHPEIVLKGLAQAKIIEKSVILFWLLNMTISCKHVHRLELQTFFNFSAAHLPVGLDIETKFPYFLFLTWLSKIRNRELENFYSYSLWTCLRHMVILRNQNKITDFLMILAWASLFDYAAILFHHICLIVYHIFCILIIFLVHVNVCDFADIMLIIIVVQINLIIL